MNLRQRVLCAGSLALCASACTQAEPATSQSAAVASAAVTTVLPQRRSFATEVAAYGSIAADPRSALELSLPQPGRVARLAVAAGQHVSAGQTLLILESDPLARLAYAQARHALAQARAELDQTQALYDQNLATQAQLAAARKTLDDAHANLAAQRALNGGERTTRLRAPVSGVVESLTVGSGARIAAGHVLLRLVPDGRLRARLGVEPSAAAALRVGDRARLTPVFGGAPLAGTVEEIGEAVDAQTHLVTVWIALPSAVRLPLGSALAARIATSTAEAWAVPRGAVLTDAHGAYLFQVADGVARRVDVKLVQTAGDPVGVDGALDPHEPVVVLGAYELADGMRVRMQGP